MFYVYIDISYYTSLYSRTVYNISIIHVLWVRSLGTKKQSPAWWQPWSWLKTWRPPVTQQLGSEVFANSAELGHPITGILFFEWIEVIRITCITSLSTDRPFHSPNVHELQFPSTCREYPLVNFHILLWKDPPFLMGKSTLYGHFQLLFVCSPEGTKLPNDQHAMGGQPSSPWILVWLLTHCHSIQIIQINHQNNSHGHWMLGDSGSSSKNRQRRSTAKTFGRQHWW